MAICTAQKAKPFLMDLVLAQEVGLQGLNFKPKPYVLNSKIQVSTVGCLPRCDFVTAPFFKQFAPLESWLKDEEIDIKFGVYSGSFRSQNPLFSGRLKYANLSDWTVWKFSGPMVFPTDPMAQNLIHYSLEHPLGFSGNVQIMT